jgi:hypothetical protein
MAAEKAAAKLNVDLGNLPGRCLTSAFNFETLDFGI